MKCKLNFINKILSEAQKLKMLCNKYKKLVDKIKNSDEKDSIVF